MSIIYREPSIDGSYQVSVHLAEGFQAILVSDWLIVYILLLRNRLAK
jgi:uncharacterized membrane protein YciS (DUF1049 family)